MSDKTEKWINLLLIILMCFIALRGLAVLFAAKFVSTLNVSLIYWAAGGAFYVLGIIGLYKLLSTRVELPGSLRLLLGLNLILMTHWTISEILLDGNYLSLNNVLFLLGVAPFALVLFYGLSERTIQLFLAVVTAVISISVIYDFVQLNDFFGLGDYQAAIQRHDILRPASEALGKSNNLYRPIGLLGPLPHNASQINSMLSVYWFLMLFTNKSRRHFIFSMGLFISSFAAVALSFVVSNVIAMMIGMGLGVFLMTGRGIGISKLWLIVLLIVSVILFLLLASIAPQIVEAITLRVDGGTGDWANILDLRMGSFFSDTLAFIFGHDGLMGSRMGTLEVGIFGLVFQFGIIIVLPFYLLMTYPIFRYMNSDVESLIKNLYFPSVMAVFTGFLTLWHYRSLLQTPNMIIFLVIYASAIVGWRRRPY